MSKKNDNIPLDESTSTDTTNPHIDSQENVNDILENVENIDLIDYSDNNLDTIHLSKKERLKFKLNQEKAKLNQMSPEKRTAYIIDYYKWYFVAFIIFVIVLVSGIKLVYRNSLPVAVTAFILNNDQSLENYELPDTITDDFTNYYNLDNKHRVLIEDGFSISLKDDIEVTSNELTDYEKLIIYIENKELDIIITDQEGLDFYATNGEFYPLASVLDEDEYKDIYDIIGNDITTAIGPDGNPYECAIDISNTQFAKDYDLGYEKIYLCVPGFPENLEGTANFIKYVYNQ